MTNRFRPRANHWLNEVNVCFVDAREIWGIAIVVAVLVPVLTIMVISYAQLNKKLVATDKKLVAVNQALQQRTA